LETTMESCRTHLRADTHRTVETIADVELATLGWVHWHHTSRLHGYLDDVPPAEFEAVFYATKRTRPTPGRIPIA
jgi:transposase InsO family protein